MSNRSTPSSQDHDPTRVVFVCLGNICRSPTAEGVLRNLVDTAELGDHIFIDSAGTSAYHAGDPPDRRSTAAAARHGVQLRGQSRQFVVSDFDRFDHIIAMDSANMRNIRRLARSEMDMARVSLLRQWSEGTVGPDSSINADVPDPYYDADDGFETVFQICAAGCRGILHSIRPGRADA